MHDHNRQSELPGSLRRFDTPLTENNRNLTDVITDDRNSVRRYKSFTMSSKKVALLLTTSTEEASSLKDYQ